MSGPCSSAATIAVAPRCRKRRRSTGSTFSRSPICFPPISIPSRARCSRRCRRRARSLLRQRKLTASSSIRSTAAQAPPLTPATIEIVGGERADSRNISVYHPVKDGVVDDAARERARRRLDISLSIVANADHTRCRRRASTRSSRRSISRSSADCPSDFDCVQPCDCPASRSPRPDIDYLAKRLRHVPPPDARPHRVLSPDWHERTRPISASRWSSSSPTSRDYLELSAGRVATEAYLGTARKRVSVRRHARLVDYPMHDGCNARVWVQVVLDCTASPSGIMLPRVNAITGTTTKFLTRVAGVARASTTRTRAESSRMQHPEVFEPLADANALSAAQPARSTRGARPTAACRKARPARRSPDTSQAQSRRRARLRGGSRARDR